MILLHLLCTVVPCINLSDPDNGIMSCLQRFTECFSAGDTCTASCNTGYEVQSGDVMRTCGSDGMWSGNDATCAIGNH